MNFVEVRRKDNAGIARVRVDAITAVVEVNAVQGEGRNRRTIHALQIQIGTNNFIVCEGDTIDSLFNKMSVARGMGPIGVVAQTNPDWPGHLAEPKSQPAPKEAEAA